MKPNSFVPLILAAVVLVPVCGCTPSREDKPPAPKVTENAGGGAAKVAAAPAAGAAMASLPKLGTAPKWTIKDLSGKEVSSEQLKGKVVVVDFWATWCPPCRAEIPGYVELQNKYGKDGLVIVGVSVDEGGPDVVQQFATRARVNYSVVMADEALVNAFGGIEVLPTTFLIDRTGQIRDRKIGAEETADYERKILAVMGEKA